MMTLIQQVPDDYRNVFGQYSRELALSQERPSARAITPPTLGTDNPLRDILQQVCTELGRAVAAFPGVPSDFVARAFEGISISDAVTINAYFIPKGGRFAITYFAPLMTLTWLIAKLWAPRVGFVDDSGKVVLEPGREPKDMHSLGASLVRAFWERRIHRVGLLPFSSLSSPHLILAAALCRYGNLFIAAHEFGHALIHFFGDQLEVRQMIKWSEEYVQPHVEACLDPSGPYSIDPDIRGKTRDSLVASWAEEIAADGIGFKLARDAVDDYRLRVLVFWATELDFISLNLLERTGKLAVSRPPLVGTHPFSNIRLDALRCQLDTSIGEDVRVVGKTFERESWEVLEHMYGGPACEPVFLDDQKV